MAIRICKACGTLYNDRLGCPKCLTAEGAEAGPEAPAAEMDPRELARKRRRDWLWICLGVPGLIGFLYLLFYLLKSII